MTTPSSRPDIIALLADADFKYRADTSTWSHRDGRPFSKEEQARVLTATRDDFEAQFERFVEYRQECADAPEALQRFLAPFMQQLTVKNLGNAHEIMSEGDRTEFNRLLGLIAEPPRPFTANTF
ncbi:hypothetical protein [Streptomyces zagrosensis]|uniref:Uncharacterized protein n=1 Tax=Streptomyces zagrosensis TaxID=1042984 RepID=A0A7W9QG35_9ACTN|nr:hypothetical protein [Streptomyces zagrosensis]MBB5939471.1 hypothetical protein [Streptomyces zagrosensis]